MVRADEPDRHAPRPRKKRPLGRRIARASSQRPNRSIRSPAPTRSGAFLLSKEETNVKSNPTVAIVGVTGAVGAEFMATMDKRKFPVGKLKALASARSAGKTADFRGQTDRHRGADRARPSKASTSRCSRPAAASRGSSRRSRSRPAPWWSTIPRPSAWHPDVPLVIPEINARRIREHKGIIANPNCAAITALVPLWPIHQAEPHQAADPVDLSGGERRRRGGDGRARRLDPRPSERRGVRAEGAAASLRVQPVQPQHADRSGDRLQRGREQGHQGDEEDLRGRPDRASASPACACRCCARTARRSPSSASSRSRKTRFARSLRRARA